MNKLEESFYRIPVEHREKLIEMLPWFRKTMKLIKNHEYTNYLFELYRTYLARGWSGTQNCGYCMQQVKHRLFLAAQTFEKFGIKLDENAGQA
jgi:hypothetical protein